MPVDASRALLARLLTDLPEGALITDAKRRVKHANAGFTAMTGYTESEIRDSNCSFLQGVGTDPATIDSIRTALEAGRTFRGPILNYRKDGAEFWNFLTIAPLRDEADVITHFVSVQLDVTDFISGHDITRQLLAAERAHRETASLLLDAARALNRSSSVAETTATISDLARSLTDGDHSTVATWDDKRRSLVLTAHSGVVAAAGFRAPVEQPDSSRLDDLDAILRAEAPVALERESSDTMRALQPELATSTGLAMPIRADEAVLGLLLVGWVDANPAPGDSAAGRLGDLAELAGYAFAKAQIFDEIRWNAVHDPLTRLLNRSVIADTLATFVERGRAEDTSTAVLYCDVDRFKHINDTLGHDAGDTVLVAVAAALQGAVRLGDIVARMGGDEFAAILPLSDSVTPEGCATAIANALRQPLLLEGQLVQSGAAIGIAYGNLAYDDGDDLLKRADMAMYEAKAANLNSYRVFDDVMEERMTSRVNIRAELTRALDSDELTLNYQPLVSARTGELKSVEALLRWNSPRLGTVSPGVLIPIAEESGQIIELSNWVLDRALCAIKTLGDVPVGINISPVHFRQGQFATMVADKLLAANIRPELLYIEITEGVLISHMDAAKKTITQLRNLGIKVYLDDFGTGYSSLSYLQNFEFDGMKIDKSFLRNLGERQQATQIMRSVIDLGHSLNLQVVAEGIESDWQARLLQLLNCDILQGFHFATPMSLDGVQAFRVQQAEALAQVAAAPVALAEVERLAG